MARINPRTPPVIHHTRTAALGLALLSGCAASPKKPETAPAPAYTLPATLLERKSDFKSPDQQLGFNFFCDLLKTSRVSLENILAVPVSNGGVFIGVSLIPKGYKTQAFPLSDFLAQIKPHAEPFKKFFATITTEVRDGIYATPELPKYETHCFVLPLFRGDSLDAVSMKGFVFAFELRTPEKTEELTPGLRPRRYNFEDLIQNYLDSNKILPAQVLIQGHGQAELETVLNRILEENNRQSPK